MLRKRRVFHHQLLLLQQRAASAALHDQYRAGVTPLPATRRSHHDNAKLDSSFLHGRKLLRVRKPSMGKGMFWSVGQRLVECRRGMRGVAPWQARPWQCKANWCRARSLPPPTTVCDPDLEIPCSPGRGDRPAASASDVPAEAEPGLCVRSVFERPGTVK